jgi:hypothetical protein
MIPSDDGKDPYVTRSTEMGLRIETDRKNDYVQIVARTLRNRRAERRQEMRGRPIRARKASPDNGEPPGLTLPSFVPFTTRLLLLRLASIAIESARATDTAAVFLGISLIRETTRELEATVELAVERGGEFKRSFEMRGTRN